MTLRANTQSSYCKLRTILNPLHQPMSTVRRPEEADYCCHQYFTDGAPEPSAVRDSSKVQTYEWVIWFEPRQPGPMVCALSYSIHHDAFSSKQFAG